MTGRPFRAAALAALLSLAAATASGDDAVGTPFGNWKATTSIATVDGAPDVDDYVAPLLTGETLTCVVAATGKSALLPEVRLFDPTGADRTPTIVPARAGKTVSFKSFPIDATGRWRVRVAGAGGTQGTYSVTFRIKARTKFGGKGLLGGSAPPTAAHAFEATRGSKITLTLRPVGKSAAAVQSVTDPTGASADLLMAALTTKKGVTTLTNFQLSGPTGTYVVVVAPVGATAKYVLDVRVTVLPRAKGSTKFVAKEPRLSVLASPQRIAAHAPATFVGHDFSISPPAHVFIRGVDAGPATVSADGTSAVVVVPDVAADSTADVAVQNADGQSFTSAGYAFVVRSPDATELRASATDAPTYRGALAGGDALDVVGAGFDDQSRVFFGDVEATVTQVLNAGRLRITTPMHARGPVVVTVQDDFGRVGTVPTPFVYLLPLWGEGDGGRLPAPTAVDDFSAARAAVGELGGGRGGDVVLSTPLRTFADGFATLGSRAAQTRLLTQDASGAFVDVADAKLPPALSMPFPYDLDDWNARAVAIGDLDGGGRNDVVIAGFSEVTTDGLSGGFMYGQNLFVSGVRALHDDGTGKQALSPAAQDKPQRLRPPLNAEDGLGRPRALLGPYAEERGDPTAIAVGDLDGDGAPDLVVAHDEFSFRRVVQDLTHVDFSANPPTIPTADADAFVLGTDLKFAFVSGTEILRNKIRTGGALTNVTELAMPLSFGGDSLPDGPTAPGYHADDVAIADVDGDGSLDIVLTWHDPTTVSVRGLKSALDSLYDGVNPPVSLDGPRVATRVLLNDGTGRFTDATSTWMPAGSSPEFWHGDRIALADLDGDGAPDLVVVSKAGVAGWTSTALAPVIATPAAATANPGTLAAGETESYTFVVAAAGRYVIETTLGTLTDSVLTLLAPGGATAASDDDGGGGFGSRIVRDLTPGTWTAQVSGYSAADAGTFTLAVSGSPATPPAVPHARTALRILRNDRAAGKFVDVTATAVPALPVGDDFRGGALKVGDVDNDGRADVLVATTEALFGAGGARISSLRVLRGGAGLVLSFNAATVPPATVDSGEAEDVQFVPSSVAGAPPSILLVSRVRPFTTQGGRFTRLFDWNR